MSNALAEPPAMPSAAARRGGFTEVLANRPFLRLWLAQALSQTAQQTVNFTILVQLRRILDLRGFDAANTAVALLILSFATPPIFFSALAGVVVDRSNKRLIMTGVNAGRAICVAGYLLVQTDWPIFVLLASQYALCFGFSTVGQLFGPAEGATIPLLVKHDLLISANALFNLTLSVSQLLGFVVLGPLLASLLGPPLVFLLAVALYLLCALLVLSLPPTPSPPGTRGTDAGRTIRGDLREVWHYVTSDALLRKGIAYLTVGNSAFLMISALAPEFVIETLHLTTNGLATVVTPAILGMVAGIITVGRIGRRFDRETLLDRALMIIGLCLCGFAVAPAILGSFAATATWSLSRIFSPSVVAAIIFATGCGITNAFIIVPSQTLLQERSTAAIRARVLSAFFTTSNAAALIPILFAGILGDLFGVVRVLAVIAVILTCTGLLAERARRQRQRRQP